MPGICVINVCTPRKYILFIQIISHFIDEKTEAWEVKLAQDHVTSSWWILFHYLLLLMDKLICFPVQTPFIPNQCS